MNYRAARFFIIELQQVYINLGVVIGYVFISYVRVLKHFLNGGKTPGCLILSLQGLFMI